MENSIILTTPLIILLSVIALLLLIVTRFMASSKLSTILSITAFLCIIASIVYALLLGAEMAEILIYVLLFALVSMLQFIPSSFLQLEQNTVDAKENANQNQIYIQENETTVTDTNNQLDKENSYEGESK